MEITWKFDPDKPEDLDRLELYQQADKMRGVLCDVSEYLRGKFKYDTTLNESERSTVEVIRTEYFRILNESGVSLD